MSADGSGRGTGRHSDRAIFRQSGLTGVAAAAGVLAGLILDISIAYRFGAKTNTDAFFVASRIPFGLVAVVMAAANQALVPAFRTSLTQRGAHSTDRLISMIVAVLVIAGVALVLLATLVALPLMRATAWGISSNEVQLAASMVPVVFAMIPLVAIAEVMRSYLNARYAFVAPALMTVVLNGLAAAMILLIAWKDIHLVAYAFLAGALAQAIFMWLMAIRQGLKVRPALDLHDEQLRTIGRLCVRPLGAAGTNPIARIGEQLMVSFLPTGSITVLNYGYLVISAIGGTVFFRSVIVALIPRLTDAHNRDGQTEVRRFTGLGVRIMLAISLPLTAFMVILGKPTAIAVFDRGQFTLSKAELLGTVLIVYAISLVGSAVQRALLAPFFARLDTRTPLRNAVYGVAANLLLLPVLVLPFGLNNTMGIIGVALAYSLAQYVNVGHAWYRLTKSDGNPARGLLGFTLKLVVASAAGAGAMILASFAFNLGDQSLVSLATPLDHFALLGRVAIVGLIGLAVMLAAMYLLAGGEMRTWRGLLRRGRPPARGGDEEPDAGEPAGGPDAASKTAPIAANLP